MNRLILEKVNNYKFLIKLALKANWNWLFASKLLRLQIEKEFQWFFGRSSLCRSAVKAKSNWISSLEAHF